jgi:hypothetical protein
MSDSPMMEASVMARMTRSKTRLLVTHRNMISELPTAIFVLIADYAAVRDLILLAHTCKAMHRAVSRIPWKCGNGEHCCFRKGGKVFQSEGEPSGCDKCKVRVCPVCVFVCHKCDEIKCLECLEIEFCERCEKYSCGNCTYQGGVCSLCGQSYCEDCPQGAGFLCDDCDQWFCVGCGGWSYCDKCYYELCNECTTHERSIHTCTLGNCDRSFCDECMDFTYCGYVRCYETICADCPSLPGGYCSARCEWKSLDESGDDMDEIE